MNAVQKHEVELVPEIHIGIAVSLEEGLLVPTIQRADAKHLAQIASESRDLATKSREGRATYEEVTGGTFTITNLGAYGIDAFTPIINPHRSASWGWAGWSRSQRSIRERSPSGR